MGVISVAPLSGLLLTVPFSVAERHFAERDRPSANLRAISPGYLSAVGTRLVQGRSFCEDDRLGTMRQYLEAWLGPRRFSLGLFGAFALTAILLAMSGVYALVSYAVSQRRTEIGLRMAIGATEHDVQLMIVRQAVMLGLMGAVVGLCLTGPARRLIAGTVRDVSIHPSIMAATSALLIIVVLMAAWLPARRAARIDPTVASGRNRDSHDTVEMGPLSVYSGRRLEGRRKDLR